MAVQHTPGPACGGAPVKRTRSEETRREELHRRRRCGEGDDQRPDAEGYEAGQDQGEGNERPPMRQAPSSADHQTAGQHDRCYGAKDDPDRPRQVGAYKTTASATMPAPAAAATVPPECGAIAGMGQVCLATSGRGQEPRRAFDARGTERPSRRVTRRPITACPLPALVATPRGRLGNPRVRTAGVRWSQSRAAAPDYGKSGQRQRHEHVVDVSSVESELVPEDTLHDEAER
jgi:hypothetical protein